MNKFCDGKRSFPLSITEEGTGRAAYLEIVDGVLVHGGDLPCDDAAKIFMRMLAVNVGMVMPEFAEDEGRKYVQ